jgi:hypothetical protein
LLATAPAFGQTSPPPERPAATNTAKPESSITKRARKEWDGISTMTRRQWNAAKRGWAKQKQKWASCNSDARRQKLSAANRWTAVGKCMIR